MKELLLKKSMTCINKYYDYDEIKSSEILYGLDVLYMFVTKTVVIFLISFFLNLHEELLVMVIFYSLLRTSGHGVHASKSSQCWIASLITFLILPFLSKLFIFDKLTYLIISSVFSIICIIYAPADTEKKPIINKKKRIILKIICGINCIAYVISLCYIEPGVISNIIMFSIILQAIVMLPITYKMFDQKYNNYKRYTHQDSIKERR